MRLFQRFSLNLCWPLVITVLMWGGNFVALKVVYRQITPEALFTLRYFVMWAALVVICLIAKVSLKIQKGDFWPVMSFGFVSMGLYLVVFTTGMKGSSAAEGALILALAPLMTAGGEILIRLQTFSWRIILGGLIAVCGVALVVFGDGQAHTVAHLSGNLIVFVSAILWALSAIMMRPLLKRYSALQLMTISFPGALPVIAFTIPVLMRTNLDALDAATWIGITHIALGSGVLGFTLFYEGVRQIGPSRAVTYQYFTPVTTAIFAWPILGTPITLTKIAGMAIVVVGLLTAKRSPGGETEPAVDPATVPVIPPEGVGSQVN